MNAHYIGNTVSYVKPNAAGAPGHRINHRSSSSGCMAHVRQCGVNWWRKIEEPRRMRSTAERQNLREMRSLFRFMPMPNFVRKRCRGLDIRKLTLMILFLTALYYKDKTGEKHESLFWTAAMGMNPVGWRGGGEENWRRQNCFWPKIQVHRDCVFIKNDQK